MKKIILCAQTLLGITFAGLKVLSPAELSSAIDVSGNATIPSSLGNFGNIEYGATTLGLVVTPNKNIYGCEKFSQ